MQQDDDSGRTFTETARRAQIVAAAIDTIAEVGYASASFVQIAERIGISRGLISYHFAGKDELIKEVVNEVIEQVRAYVQPRVQAQSTGSGTLRAYIESNLAFVREHPNHMIAMVEIALNRIAIDGDRRFLDDAGVADPVGVLGDALARFQTAGELRADFDPHAMAIAIRAAIDAVPSRIAFDRQLDIDKYASEIANLFELATRVAE